MSGGQQNFNSKRYLLPRFEVNYKDFLRGQNSYEKYPDGGFVNTIVGANMWAQRGYLSTSPSPSHESDIPLVASTHAVQIVAWGDSNIPGAPIVAIGHDPQTGHGYFYQVDISTGVFTLQDSDTVRLYGTGATNAVFMDVDYFVTSETDIARWSGTGVASPQNYWTGTLAQVPFANIGPHFLSVYLGIVIFVSDGNILHEFAPTTGVVERNVLTLPPGTEIDAMTSSSFMVGEKSYLVIAGHQPNGRSNVFFWDYGTETSGLSTSYNFKYEIEGIVSSFVVFQGILYAFVPNGLLFYDGVKFKSIHSTGGFGLSAPRAWQVSTNQDSIFFIDTYDTQDNSHGSASRLGTCITRYGRVINAGKTMNVFSKYLDSPSTAYPNFDETNALFISSFNTLFTTSFRQDETSSKSWYYTNGGFPGYFGLDNTSSTKVKQFLFNERHFQYPVRCHKLVARYKDINPNADPSLGDTLTFGYFDHKGDSHLIGSLTPADVAAGRLLTREFDILENPMTYMVQPWCTVQGNAKLFDMVIQYYLSEDVINQ